MAAFRKKPLVIDAVQFMGFDQQGRPQFETFDDRTPRWLPSMLKKGVLFIEKGVLYARTLEGTLRAHDGCYIVRGIKGEIYPCDEAIFEASYELAHQPL